MKIQCRKDLGFLKDLTPVGVHGHPSICGKDLGFLEDLTPVGVLRRPSPPLVGLNGFLIFFFFFFLMTWRLMVFLVIRPLCR